MSGTVRIILPASFSSMVGYQRDVTVEADSVRSAVDQLIAQIPDLKSHLLDHENSLQPFVKLFVEKKQVVDLDQSDLNLKDDTEILILSALAGG